MRDYPGARRAPGAGSGTRAQRVFDQITFERLAITLLHDQPVDVAVEKLDQALRRVAERACRFDQRAPYRIQIKRPAADDLEHVGGDGLLCQRLGQFLSAAVELLLEAGSGETTTAHDLWRVAALQRHCLAASRFSRFGTCFGAPSHCLSSALNAAF